MHPDDYHAFCCFPTWENVQFAGGEELPVWVKAPMQRIELLTVAVASTAGEHLTPTQQLELQKLLDKFADIFSPDRKSLALVNPDLGITYVIDTGLEEPVTQAP